MQRPVRPVGIPPLTGEFREPADVRRIDGAALGPGRGRSGLGGSVAMVRVDAGTHAVNLTHPAPVNEAIAAFLAAL